MSYNVKYFCTSNTGKCRKMNQDNYICDGRFTDYNGKMNNYPLMGSLSCDVPSIIGVFDGMGGEECGEIASFIAAKCAAKTEIGNDPVEDLLSYCKDANEKICEYAAQNGVKSMGTTAALLVFAKSEIALCNIGDSKIFRFADGELKQISKDHYAAAAFGQKPPLSQCLGIPETEMVIDPYVARGTYKDGDVFLICSDGLTDMVITDEIVRIMKETKTEDVVNTLLAKALENGGKDNITIIACLVERVKQGVFQRIFG